MTARRTKFTAKKKAAFLDLLRSGTRRCAAARAVGIDRSTAYRHSRDDPDFAAAVEEAETEANEVVEDALFKAATEGGNVTAMQVWLYNRCPDRWQDRRSVKVSATATLESLTPAELRERARRRGLTLPDSSDLQ